MGKKIGPKPPTKLFDSVNTNWSINLPQKILQDYWLFHCPHCGIIDTVISRITNLRNDEEELLTLKLISPENEVFDTVLENTLTEDTEIIEELVCGQCGTSGNMTDVPGSLLANLGFLNQ